jgi:FtsZ-binding cell division protein ZapB
MTSTSIVSARSWRREEARQLPPFQTADDALKACACSPDEREEFQERFYLPRSRLVEGIKPRFRLAVDESRLTQVGCPAEDIELVLAARDLDYKNYVPLARWPLPEVPAEYSAGRDGLHVLKSYGGFDFAILAVLARRRPKTANVAYRQGSVLARRILAIRAEADAPSFPIKFEDLAQFGWPRDALWVVNYLSPEPDFNQPVAQVLELWINKTSEQKFVRASTIPLGKVFMELIASDVFAEVAIRVLSEIDELAEDNDDSLAKQIVQSLRESSGHSFDQLKELATREQERFRTLVQAMFGLAPEVAGVELMRLS